MPIPQELLERIARNEYVEPVLNLAQYALYEFFEEFGEEFKHLTEAEGRALVAALNSNRHIKELLTSECIVPGSMIYELIATNITINSLSIPCCRATALSTLPLNVTLTKLYVGPGDITPEVLGYIMQNQVLKTLVTVQWRYRDIATTIPTLSRHPSIENLSLIHANIRDEEAVSLGENRILKKLNLNGNWIGLAGIIGLSRSETITHLKLASNQLTDECIPYLLRMPSLIELDISDNRSLSSSAVRLLQESHIEVIDASRTAEDRYLLFTFDGMRQRMVEAGPVFQVGRAATEDVSTCKAGF
jgi:hypothetical protein